MSQQVKQLIILVAEASLQDQVSIRQAFQETSWHLYIINHGQELLDYLSPAGTQE